MASGSAALSLRSRIKSRSRLPKAILIHFRAHHTASFFSWRVDSVSANRGPAACKPCTYDVTGVKPALHFGRSLLVPCIPSVRRQVEANRGGNFQNHLGVSRVIEEIRRLALGSAPAADGSHPDAAIVVGPDETGSRATHRLAQVEGSHSAQDD